MQSLFLPSSLPDFYFRRSKTVNPGLETNFFELADFSTFSHFSLLDNAWKGLYVESMIPSNNITDLEFNHVVSLSDLEYLPMDQEMKDLFEQVDSELYNPLMKRRGLRDSGDTGFGFIQDHKLLMDFFNCDKYVFFFPPDCMCTFPSCFSFFFGEVPQEAKILNLALHVSIFQPYFCPAQMYLTTDRNCGPIDEEVHNWTHLASLSPFSSFLVFHPNSLIDFFCF